MKENKEKQIVVCGKYFMEHKKKRDWKGEIGGRVPSVVVRRLLNKRLTLELFPRVFRSAALFYSCGCRSCVSADDLLSQAGGFARKRSFCLLAEIETGYARDLDGLHANWTMCMCMWIKVLTYAYTYNRSVLWVQYRVDFWAWHRIFFFFFLVKSK